MGKMFKGLFTGFAFVVLLVIMGVSKLTGCDFMACVNSIGPPAYCEKHPEECHGRLEPTQPVQSAPRPAETPRRPATAPRKPLTVRKAEAASRCHGPACYVNPRLTGGDDRIVRD
jgi:hypothetical protein